MYLLIAGDNFYPESGTGDWKKSYKTYEEAREQVIEIPIHTYFTKGKNIGKIRHTHTYYKLKYEQDDIYKRKYDWYEIVDLNDWIKN